MTNPDRRATSELESQSPDERDPHPLDPVGFSEPYRPSEIQRATATA